MNNNRIIAIGYPLGRIKIEEEDFFQVESAGTYRFGMSTFVVWAMCLSANSYENTKKTFNENYGTTNINFDEVINQIEENGFIIKLNLESVDESVEILMELKPIRQGSGIGYSGSDEIYSININGKVELDIIEYLIWVSANGSKTFKQIFEDLAKENIIIDRPIVVLKIILTMFEKGTIFLSK